MIRITPLEEWVNKITGGDIQGYQLTMLNETLKIAQNSVYYRKTLPPRVERLTELSDLPTISADILTKNGTGLVCVPQNEISRIVTLPTSGTTGEPKRVYFTEADQELTVDYFSHGLTTAVDPGGTMAILLPCNRPGGVGELIARALLRIPVTPVRYGLIGGLLECAETLRASAADALVGIPVQVLALARYCAAKGIGLNIRSVLLSTDNIPRVVVRELKNLWKCEVYEHFGMTETGLGGAIDCDAHDGYHIRENDLLFEILDDFGNPVPDDEAGELVFTTLTRRGMPLIRYRTGDCTKIIPGRCACGSGLRRISPITGRRGGDVAMVCGAVIKMREFDEVMFSVPQVCDYTLHAEPNKDLLKVEAETQRGVGEVTAGELERVLRDSGLTGGLEVELRVTRMPDVLTSRTGKRAVKQGRV